MTTLRHSIYAIVVYAESNPIFRRSMDNNCGVELWSQFEFYSNRTNNICESFHHSFSRRFHTAHQNLYIHIGQLQKVEALCYFKYIDEGGSKMKCPSKYDKLFNSRLKDNIELLKNGGYSLNSLLYCDHISKWSLKYEERMKLNVKNNEVNKCLKRIKSTRIIKTQK